MAKKAAKKASKKTAKKTAKKGAKKASAKKISPNAAIPIATDVPKPPKDPAIVELGSQKVAVVTTKGDPNVVLQDVMPALYGAAYTLKFDLKKKNPGGETFKVMALRGRWPDAHEKPKNEWTGILALPVPEDTVVLPQKVPEVEVKLDTWQYGTCACVLHIGPYTEEASNIERLHKFIVDSGYVFNGVHEEWYLTRPNAKIQKTLLLHPIRKAANEEELDTFRKGIVGFWNNATSHASQ